MKSICKSLRRAILARPRRERAVLLVVSIVAVAALGHLLWIEPAMQQRQLLRQGLEQQRTQLLALAPVMQALRSRNVDPDASRKAQIDVLRTRLAQLDEEVSQLQHSLVAPGDMGQLIEGLLKQHGGLQLLGLRSLPVLPLSQRDPGVTPLALWSSAASAPAAASVPASGASGAAAASPGPHGAPNDNAEAWLYLHGMQITVQGSYADMQAYLDALEHLPRHLLWGTLQIDAQAWPASVMTVTIYTVSMEPTWWSV